MLKKTSCIIIIGQRLRLSNSIGDFRQLLKICPIPFATTKLAIDILPEHPCNMGMVGIRGNYRIPSDINVVYVLGASLSMMTRGYNNELFNKNSRIIEVGSVKELQSLLLRRLSVEGAVA